MSTVKGESKTCADKYAIGTSVIKEDNVTNQLLSVSHATAAEQRGEIRKDTYRAESSTSNSLPKKTTILARAQNLNARQKEQLIREFQLTHFIVWKGKSFNLFADMAKFEKSILGRIAAKEMVV